MHINGNIKNFRSRRFDLCLASNKTHQEVLGPQLTIPQKHVFTDDRNMHFPIPGGPIRNLFFQNLPCNTTITFNIFFKSLSGIFSGNSSQLFSLIIIRAGKAESSYKISNSTYILQLTSMSPHSIGGTHRFLDFFQYLFHPFTHLTRWKTGTLFLQCSKFSSEPGILMTSQLKTSTCVAFACFNLSIMNPARFRIISNRTLPVHVAFAV